MRFNHQANFEQQMATIAQDIRHRYTLTFQPTSRQLGYHAIGVSVSGLRGHARIAARPGYWLASESSLQ